MPKSESETQPSLAVVAKLRGVAAAGAEQFQAVARLPAVLLGLPRIWLKKSLGLKGARRRIPKR